MPVITSSDCEGGGEAFRLAPLVHDASPSSGLTTTVPQEFFGQPAYLTVSSQLHLEALAASLARVYNLGPCFRAEPSQTSRHLAEFWMLEAEWAFCNSVSELSGFIEGAIKHVLSALPTEPVLPSQADPSRTEALRAAADPSKPWARMTYTEAIAELEKHSDQFEFKPVWGHGLQSEHERFLAGTVVKGPVFVTDYPASIKPFYCRANAPDSEGRETVACLDLLVPGVGELVGGAVREERLELLEAAIKKAGLSEEEYSWYVDLRRHGSAPHGGFGMGFERLIGWVTGIENVRECVAMPRWAGRMLL
jgi:asparaginyl-tRNA synthetase